MSRCGRIPEVCRLLVLLALSAAEALAGIAAAAGESRLLLQSGSICAVGNNTYGQLGDGTAVNRTSAVFSALPAKIVDVSASWRHSLAVGSDGQVWSWGSNSAGQLGNGTTTSRLTPAAVPDLDQVIAVAAGSYHSLALKRDGTVWAWGDNGSGQLGDGSRVDSRRPKVVIELTDVVAIGAGSAHSVALKRDGTVWTWGNNSAGELGNRTTLDQSKPVLVADLSDVKAIAVGYYHTLALRSSDGSVWSWGRNTYGQLGNGSTGGSSSSPVRAVGLQAISSVGAGGYHSLAVRADSTAVAWGYNNAGQLGNGATATSATPVQVRSLTAVTAIVGGESFSLATTSDGSSWAWGANSAGQLGTGSTSASTTPVKSAACSATPIEITAAPNARLLSAAQAQSFVARADGTLSAWGVNTYGQLGDGTTASRATPAPVANVSGVRSVSASWRHTLAVTDSGRVWAWGINSSGQLGDGSRTTRPTPFPIPDLTGVTMVAAGSYHSLALKDDGTVWAWGDNAAGQLGDGSGRDQTRPVLVLDLTGIVAIAAGSRHSVALRRDGTVWTWGSNTRGELASGLFTEGPSPTQVAGLTDIVAIASGYNHVLALKRTDGSVWSWGGNSYGQLGNGDTGTGSPNFVRASGLTGVVSVSAGGYHSIAVQADGSAWAWGYNQTGQLGVGSATTATVPTRMRTIGNAVAAAGGEDHSIILSTDGTLFAAGSNASGQFGVATPASSTVPIRVGDGYVTCGCSAEALPRLTSLSPPSETARDGEITINLTGTGFRGDSYATWNGARLATTFVSSTELRATAGREQMRTSANAAIAVVNPPSTASNELQFRVLAPTSPPPEISSVTPAQLIAGAPVTLRVAGRNFSTASVVRYNSTAVQTTFRSSTELEAAFAPPVADTGHRIALSVANSASSFSAVFEVNVVAPAGPSLLSANPTVIDFQATQSNLSQFSDELLIQLSDAAGGSTYTAIPNQGWLSVRPASGVLPAVLRVAVNAQGLQPGTYTGAIAVTTSSGAQLPLSVTFRVTTADPSSFKVLSPSIQLVATGTAADEGRTAVFGVKNTGAQTMRFQFGKKNSSAAWFKVTPDSADISVDQAIEVKVQLQAGGLPGGVTASETVTVTAGGVTREIPVVVTVASATGGTPLWSLSEGGTTMFNSKGAWSEETQTIYLANAGPGTLDWAATEELGLVTVTPAFKDVMPAGGVQDLTLRTTSAVEKSLEKQSVLVFRRTGTADAKTFIVYIEQVDGVLPPRPNVAGVILNLGPQSRSKVKLRYTASGSQEVTFPNKPAWLDIVYPGSPGPAWMRDKKGIEMEFAINDLSKVQIGQHFTLTLNFPGMPKINGKEHLINIEIVIGGVLTRAACAPVELQAVFLNPPSLSDLKARLPTPVEAEIVDNCGEPLRSGAASVIFSSEDPSIALSLWPDGIWRGTWQPVDVSKPQVTLKLSAISNQNLRPAHAFAAVSVLPNAQQPVIQQGGVRNAANITRPNADSLAPGSMISLAGEQLAPREETYSGVPSTTLAGVRVSIGGRYATLLYASPKRINAVVPFDSPLGPTQLIVEREGAFSVPLPVVVVGAQPGIFTEDQSGAGQGSVLTEDGVLAGPQNPARRGRIIQIYCTGLGPVEPNPPSGQAAPSSPPARVTASRVALVGGNSAEIVFAGLVPGYWGLYQVNVRVPEDVTPGSAVPVRLLIDGFESNTVTIGVQ